MSFWSAVVVLAIIVAVVHLRLAKYRAFGPRTGAAPIGSPSSELEREIAELRRRLEVMERIVTDERRSRAVADEIEALREGR